MELERDVSVHTEGEVVIHNCQGQSVFAFLARLRVRILLHVQLPAIQMDHLPIWDVAQDLADWLVGIPGGTGVTLLISSSEYGYNCVINNNILSLWSCW